jgi:hypothetical protein
MFHWVIVGPIPGTRVEMALDEFGRDVEPYVSREGEGRVVFRWAAAPLRLWERVKAVAHFLARRERADVLDERMEVVARPPDLPSGEWRQKRA